MNNHQRAPQKRNRKPRIGPGRPAAGDSLTPQEITRAALQLIAAQGESALTMRRLGEALGVKAMALYNHFQDKEAILDAVADLALAGVPPAPDKGHWKTRIKALCFGIRGMALRQPNVFRVAMTRRTPPESALPHVAAALSAFADAGLSPAAQAIAYQTVRLYVRAHCLWEIEELGATHPGDLSGFTRAASECSKTAAAAKLVLTPDPDRQFKAGLDLILRGLQVSNDR